MHLPAVSQNTYATVKIAVKKVAREELTACSEPAKDMSIVSMS